MRISDWSADVCSSDLLPLLDHFGVGLLDEKPDPSERLAPPIIQLLDSRIDQPRGRVFFCTFHRAALRLLHGCRCFLHGCCRPPSPGAAPAAHIRSPGSWLACFTQAASWTSSSSSSSWMSR